MDKLDMQTPNFTDENIEKLAGLFPNCVTEAKDANGKLKKAIDFDLLKQELSENIVDGPRERYQISWPGKKEALISANTPINKTLRPCREESVDFDTTENLYIEGDNLEALKLLQESYLGKIKMIYIDPPYNTGKDFVYKDNFTANKDEYELDSEQRDEQGGRLIANPESNGRYHSDWMNMMYPRLRLAKNLLKDDGIVCISLDDNEIVNLKKICDEIFGEENFISQLSVVNNIAGRSDKKHIATAHEYVLIYQKSEKFQSTGLPLSDEQTKDYNKIDKSGKKYREQGLRKRGSGSLRKDRPNMFYPVFYNELTQQISLIKDELESSIEIIPKLSTGEEGRWRWGRDTFIKKQNLLGVKKVERRNEYDIYERVYLEVDGIEKTTKMKSFLLDSAYTTDTATSFLSTVIEPKIFESPKPLQLIENLLRISNDKNALVLDFFSGSGTSAHAVFQLNLKDNGNRNFIMVQISEETDEKSKAYEAGYKTIPEIGKERIRRAGKKIKEENTDKDGITDLDIGFRVLKIDSSNMKDVYYTPDQMNQSLLDSQEQNIKEDRTAEDLLFQVLLDWGVDLSLPIRREEIQGKTVYFVDEDTLVACFDDGLDAEFAEEIARKQPLRAVFKESGYKQDEDKINIDQVILQFSPDTEVRAI